YSAMTGANLKAVDRVVRIVRELDRYHVTFAPAGRRLPGASDREAPAEGTAAYGAALICWAQFAPGDSGDIEFEQNMQLTLSPLERGEGWGEGLGRLAADLLPVNRETDAPAPLQATIARKFRRETDEEYEVKDPMGVW